MIIYYEPIIIISLVIHYVLTILSIRLTKCGYSAKSLVLGTLLDGIYIFLYIRGLRNSLFIVISFLIITRISFKNKYLSSSLFYLLLNFLLGGVVTLFNISLNMTIFVISIFLLFMFILIDYYMLYQKNENQFLHEIKYRGKVYQAFIDSGNNLMVDGKLVVFMKKRTNEEFVKVVKIKTVSGESMIYLYKLEDFYFSKEKIDGYIAFSDIPYDVLLSIHFTNFLGRN